VSLRTCFLEWSGCAAGVADIGAGLTVMLAPVLSADPVAGVARSGEKWRVAANSREEWRGVLAPGCALRGPGAFHGRSRGERAWRHRYVGCSGCHLPGRLCTAPRLLRRRMWHVHGVSMCMA
jgi:hypothetical protein